MKLAVVQDGPIFNDKKATIEKTCQIIEQVSKEDVNLVVFGENWLCGYPIWLDICKDVNLWEDEGIKDVWSQTYKNSIDINSDDLKEISDILKEKNIYAVIGANEVINSGKGNGTIYNSLFTFNNSGNIVNHHRKLMPTFTEKLVHGLGDGYGLKTIDTDFGKLGSLICWEHWMPLTRQAMHDEGEDLHIGVWPFAKEMHHLASRHYAIEGRCHVVAVGQIMERNELPSGLQISDKLTDQIGNYLLRGGSAVYDSQGNSIIDPIYDERKIIYSDLDLSKNIKDRMNLAVSGHYQRHDVFRLGINKNRQSS